ncbi:PAS domain-containing protein [Bacillus timonensis]|nr:PAS domain-containing protein [Bacillus timonensis]
MKNRIAQLYFVGSIIWLVLTDYLINQLDHASSLYEILQLGKGLVFVLLTTLLIHIVVKKEKAIKEVEENEQLLNTLINSMPDIVGFKDGEGRWLKINDFGIKLYMLENINYFGKTDLDMSKEVPFYKEAFEYCVVSDQATWDKGSLTREEESFYVPSGELKTFDVIKVPLFNEDGSRKGLVTIGRDISQLKAAESLLLRKEKLSVVGELAAGIAHEIRNPLTSIKGFVQLMRDSNTHNKEHFPIILSELERINQIVSEMLVFAKPQSKSMTAFQLEEVISYAIKLTSHEATLHDVHVDVSNKHHHVSIWGDKNQLIQVFINVIKNAIDAMPSGGKLSIIVEKVQGDKVSIKLIDNGQGIPADRLEKIGEPFYTLKEKGVGLGLTISNKILHEHKGTLNIESEVGKGTTVEVILPLHKEL